MIDISIVIPAIRQPKWFNLYQSIVKSCKKYEWELILISPFDLPEELKEYKNIKLVKDYGSPTRCLQLGIFEANGKLFYHTTDDALCYEDAIDEAIDFYHSKGSYKKDVINMMYREGENYSGDSMPDGYWHAWFHEPLRLIGIPRHYKLSLHHLLNTDYLIELGGYDCSYQHANFSLHDLMFRIQHDGGQIYNAPRDITTCDHSPARSGDHAAVNDSHIENDLPLFQKTYSQQDVLKNRIKIDINNWTNADSIWKRRFKGNEKSYMEVLNK